MEEAQRPAAQKSEGDGRGIIPAKLHLPLLAALAVLVAALALSYLDRYGVKQDLEMVKLNVAIQQLADQQAGAFAGEDRPVAGGASSEGRAPAGDRWQGEWRSVTSPDGRYRMDLPPGVRLMQSEGYTYVMVDPPSPDEELPYMAIKIATGVDRQGYRPNPTSSVMKDVGRNTYWLYTWEFMEWEPFVRIAASFEVLE
jgi:hypothetical protein